MTISVLIEANCNAGECMTLKLINTIAQRAPDRDGFTEADRREISGLGRTKAERAKIYKALDVFVDLVVTKREFGKFSHQLKLNSNARSQLMGIIGQDGMGLLRKQFANNPGIAHAKLVDPKSSAKVRATAARHIGKSNDPAAVHVLTNALKTERNWSVRFAIAKALIKVDSRTRKRPDVITVLVTAYRKGDDRVRAYALSKLRDVHTRAVTNIFIDASKHRNPVIRSASVRVLAKNHDPKAKVALLKALKDKDESVRDAVPRLLALEVERVHGIIKLLKSSKTKPADRDYLIKKLSKVKEPVARIVVAELAKLVKHRDASMRFIAVTALKPFRGENVVDVFIPLLEDKNDKMRELAVEYFAKVGSVRGLVTALKNKDVGVRFRAMGGLEKAKKPLPYAPLLTALKDPLDSIRRSATNLLAKYKSPPVISALIARLKTEPVRTVRMAIVRALAVSSDAKAIGALAMHVEKEPNDYIRYWIEIYLGPGLLKKFFGKRPVSELVKDLAHPAYIIRKYAAQRLGRDGDMSAISKLHARLQKEPNDGVKWIIRVAMTSIATKSLKNAPVSALLKTLAHPSPTVRMHAAQYLGERGSMSTISKLHTHLQKERNKEVKGSIEKAMKRLATKSLQYAPVSKLLKALAHPTATVRLVAARFLRRYRVASAVPTLLTRLTKEPSAGVRVEIVGALASIKADNATITTAIIKATKDPSPRVREIAVWSLSYKKGSRATSTLIKSTKDANKDVRYAAFVQLGGMNGTEIVTALIRALRDPYDGVQIAAVKLLISQWHSKRSSQKDRSRILSAIIAGSKARKRSLRLNSLWALLRMKNQKALRALSVALKHPDMETRRYAERLFSEIKTKRYAWAIPTLTGLLKSRSKTIREYAGWSLCRIGTEHSLLAALKSSDAGYRAAVAEQLGEGAYPNAIRTLVSLLEDPAPVVQGTTIRALIDKKDPSVVPAIAKLLSHSKAVLRKDAIYILAEREDPESVIALASAIKSDDPYVRKIATQALLKDARSLQTLLTVLMKPKHRMYGVVADLIKKYKQYYKPMLGKMLRGNSKKWALGALTGLEVIGDADAVTKLLAELKRFPSDTDFQRYAARDFVEIAVRALVKSKDPRVLPAFSQLLKERGFNIWPQVLRVLIRAKFPVTHRAFYDNRNNYNGWFIAVRLVQGLDKSGNIEAITAHIMDAGFLSSRWIVAALVEMNDVRALPILLKVLAKEERYDRNALFRPEGYSEALKAFKKVLWRFARPEAIPYFAAELNEVTIEMLIAIGGPRVTSILLDLLPSEHPWMSDIVWAAVDALAKTKNPRVEAKLIDYVKEKRDWLDPDRYLDPYIKALGEMGSKKAVPLIINKLESYDVSVRMTAATALGKIKDRRAIKALIERMLKDKEGSVRGLAARALGEIGDPRAIKALLRVSEKDTDEWVRNEALKALHKLPSQLIRAS